MSEITPFAESLLADQRKRNDQERKRRERRERNAVIGKIGLGLAESIGNELLAQQTQDFINKTEFKSAQQIARAGDSTIARMEKELAEIRGSEQDPIQYLITQAKPIVENEMSATEPYSSRSTKNYEATIYEGAKQIAEERWRILTEAEKIWQDNNLTQNDQRVLLAAKNYRPDTIQDLITSKLASFVSGRDQQDADMRELLVLQDYINDKEEGTRGYFIKELQALNEEFDRTGDFQKAREYAKDMMARLGNPEQETKDIVSTTLVKADDNTFFTKETTTTYVINSDGSLDDSSKVVREKLLRGADGEVEIVDMRSEDKRVKAAMDMFDYHGFIDKNFDRDAKREFFQVIRDSGARNLGEIDTFEEYKTFSDAFYELASNTSNYELDSTGEEYFKQGLAEWHKTSGVRLQAKISVLEGEGRDTTQAENDYMRALANVSRGLRENAELLDVNDRPDNLEGPTTNTPQDKLEKYNNGETIYVDEAMVRAYPTLADKLGTTIRLGVSSP